MARDILVQEARALLTRLARVEPFALHMPMVPAAGVSPEALAAVEHYLADGRRDLRRLVHEFLAWLRGPDGGAAAPDRGQRRFTYLKLRFYAVLSQFDVFAEAMTQRCEHGFGVWLSGLDVAAADALALPEGYFTPPPVICYLDRGPGAAIRRVRTRLPGGGKSPVAVVRVPRERMVGSGIASSLVHEVGHQAQALLDLVPSFRPVLERAGRHSGATGAAWRLWRRWVSEILPDLWAVAKVGVAAVRGLMGVVSLPRDFVFRINPHDPHPTPWIRVKLCCALGDRLFPHPQWGQLAGLWERYYPTDKLRDEVRQSLSMLELTMPHLVELLVNHRPPTLRGSTLAEALWAEDLQPARLAAIYRTWRRSPARMRVAKPSLAMAVIGQAKADGEMSPEADSRIVAELLTHWAVTSKVGAPAARRAQSRRSRGVSLVRARSAA